jgi:putative transposase
MIDRDSTQLSVRTQCELLKINRNRLAPPKVRCSPEDLKVCRQIDKIHLEAPSFGSRNIRKILEVEYGRKISRDRVRRLMRQMGIRAIYQRPRTSLPGQGEEHQVFPYLLREREVKQPDEVWCTDITYLPMGRSFAYLVAVMDWHSRAVLSWKLSNTMDTRFCLEALNEAVQSAGKVPEIFNTDQGSQFTSRPWRQRLQELGVKISMDGKGRWMDNVFIERLWRSVKYEEVYLREYQDLHELERCLGRWFERYNHWRPHQGLNEQRPWEIYRPEMKLKKAA